MKKHYIYAGWLEGEIVYIGKGFGSRYLHLKGGCSHVYEANKEHFGDDRLEVTFLKEGLTTEDSNRLEKELILQYKPVWNKQYLKNDLRYLKMTLAKEMITSLLEKLCLWKKRSLNYKKHKDNLEAFCSLIVKRHFQMMPLKAADVAEDAESRKIFRFIWARCRDYPEIFKCFERTKVKNKMELRLSKSFLEGLIVRDKS